MPHNEEGFSRVNAFRGIRTLSVDDICGSFCPDVGSPAGRAGGLNYVEHAADLSEKAPNTEPGCYCTGLLYRGLSWKGMSTSFAIFVKNEGGQPHFRAP
jgi:hypothetical protein